MNPINMNDILGIILAGGQGSRLDPLTRNRSKPAVPFGGKYRIIDFPITNCIHSGVGKIFVLTQFHSASLNQHITQTYKFDFFHDSFVDIIASEASKDLSNSGFSQGTADAVRKGMHHITSIRNASHGLILAGDQLYHMDFKTLRNIHNEYQADLTLGVVA
ncbi:MAG: sugar phosphate nucleotidyltransferase, partial [Brevinema sp.]